MNRINIRIALARFGLVRLSPCERNIVRLRKIRKALAIRK